MLTEHDTIHMAGCAGRSGNRGRDDSGCPSLPPISQAPCTDTVTATALQAQVKMHANPYMLVLQNCCSLITVLSDSTDQATMPWKGNNCGVLLACPFVHHHMYVASMQVQASDTEAQSGSEAQPSPASDQHSMPCTSNSACSPSHDHPREQQYWPHTERFQTIDVRWEYVDQTHDVHYQPKPSCHAPHIHYSLARGPTIADLLS